MLLIAELTALTFQYVSIHHRTVFREATQSATLFITSVNTWRNLT